MEDIKERRTSGQREVLAEVIDAAHRHEHADGATQGEKGPRVERQLRIVDEGLAGARDAHHVAHLLAELTLEDRSGEGLDTWRVVALE